MKQKYLSKNARGFTLIELLIVVAIIAILAAVIFVALDPLKRFQDSRDSVRWQEVTSIAQAIELDFLDNGGVYLSDIDVLTVGNVYMIVDGAMGSGCEDNNAFCDTNVTSSGSCVDLSDLVAENYLPDIPVAPDSGDVAWDDGGTIGDEGTGYTLERISTSTIYVRACESENSTEIEVLR